VDDVVVVTDLVKRYRPQAPAVVDELSFAVGRGEVFGLLGPNGAGKTTTVGVLTTRVLPTSGHASIEGVDVVKSSTEARRLLAVVPQQNNLDRSLSIRQNLAFHAAYHGIGRTRRRELAEELLELMGLADRADDSVAALSGGQAQRVMIARALMHEPQVLFLDEPSTGLDPQSRIFVHERVEHLRRRGLTVVITTHDMDEATKLCDRVGIVDSGKLLALDTPANLTKQLAGTDHLTLRLNSVGTGGAAVLLSEVDGVTAVEDQCPEDPGRRFRLYTEGDSSAVAPSVVCALADAGCGIAAIEAGTASLEDVFIHLTGRELR
jgi:ABC-2 type transport system ATP-binding protein